MGSSKDKPRSARQLGIMQGYPPPPDKRPDPTNWDLPPFNRWSFMNIRSLFPTVDVRAAGRHSRPLPKAGRDLSAIEFHDHSGDTTTLPEFLESSYTDGFAVLHRGRVVSEQYFNDMRADTPHLSQSVAKSIVGSLAGILHARGLVDPDAPLTTYVPELAHCGYHDAKLAHALDMTSGVRFSEDYNAPDSDMTRIDIAAGWRPVPNGDSRPTIRDVILSSPKIREHGEHFEYRSIETDVVAWALERVAERSLAELVSEYLWKPIGAEHDGFFTVDQAATALADGGFNATLRDYARFGLMMQNDGRVGNTEVVPKAWVDECARGRVPVDIPPYCDICPDGAYGNFWWVHNSVPGDFMARGVFGQMIYIDRAAALTIVKLSTWPDYLIPNFTRDALTAFAAIREHLG